MPAPAPDAAADYVHISRVQPHPRNIRKDLGDLTELAASIRIHGILQPLAVFPHPHQRGRYVIIAGHRRLAAARIAGADEIPITIRPAPGPAGAVVLMLVENCQRADLGPIEKAEAMGALRDRERMSATAIARATGLTASTVSYYLSLLELDAESRELVRAGQITAADAVGMIRQVHHADRRRNGKPSRRPVAVTPPYFGTSHPLADAARHLHRIHGHGRALPGGVACGQCWEQVIRQAERGEPGA